MERSSITEEVEEPVWQIVKVFQIPTDRVRFLKGSYYCILNLLNVQK